MTTVVTGRPHPLDVILGERGLTMAALASSYRDEVARQGLRSGADRQLMWKWKSGTRFPNADSQRILADVLGVPQTLVQEHGWPA